MVSAMLSSTSSARVAPFRTGTASRAGVRLVSRSPTLDARISDRTVAAASAHLEPKKLAQAAFSAVAAGCVALQLSGPAFAADMGISLNPNQAKENVEKIARDKKDSQSGGTIKGKQMDKNSGNVDTFQVAGVAQADAREPNGRSPMNGPNEKASLEDQVNSLPTTRGDSNSAAAKQMDSKSAIAAANDRSAPVSFSLGGLSLQTNVTFGTGDVGTMRDQAVNTQDKAKAALSNPVEAAEQTADRIGRAADKTFVNPAGVEQSKQAADELSKANAEIPKALNQGFSDLKKQLTQPTSTRTVDSASLLHTMQGFSSSGLQHEVRVGDLQSITGGQAKKAGSDEVSKADSKGGSDDQLITNESTSGVKARGASGNPSDKGGADRAAERVEKLTNDKTMIP